MKTAVGEVQGEALTLVNTTNTAIAAESGSLPVLGTPFMLALMEKATCEAVADLLEDDETTVGTAMNITHIKASAIGSSSMCFGFLFGLPRDMLAPAVFLQNK